MKCEALVAELRTDDWGGAEKIRFLLMLISINSVQICGKQSFVWFQPK